MKRKVLSLVLVMVIAISSLGACGKNEKIVIDPGETTISASTETTVSNETEINEPADEIVISTESTNSAEEPTENAESDTLVRNPDGTVNYLYYYSSVLSRVHYVMTYSRDDFEYAEGEDWLYEITNYANGTTNLGNYGYCLDDISGDGIPELILTDKQGMTVYNLYTLVDYDPFLVCSGYFNCNYAYMGGNRFEQFVSAGGMYQTMGIYELSENGQELVTVDYYFTCESDTSREIKESYHNTTGESDKEKSELIDNDDFLLAWCQYEEQITPLSNVTLYSEKTIEIAYAEDNPGKTVSGKYVADITEYAQTVFIYDNNGMSDIELLGLTFLDYTDRGFDFSINYIYNMGETTGDEGINVTITFGEIVPLFGIQYTDANGVLRKFAIDVSGEDGSVYLWEF